MFILDKSQKEIMKVNVNDIVKELQSLYAKDKKSFDIIATGASVRQTYSDKDMVVLQDESPLRALIGLAGIPYNKIIQVAGKKDTGKSTFAAEAMVAAQKQGTQVICWDSEDKFDANRFAAMGGEPKDVLLIKTNEILKGAETARKMITAVKDSYPKAKILFIWDSVGASQSRSHAERELDSEKHAQPGQDAKENGSVMKMLVALINKYPDSIAIYLVNQTYAKIGFMQKGDQATGGAKIEYHSSLIIMLKSIKTLTKVVKGVTRKVGIVSRATVTKNHLTQGESSIHTLDFMVNSLGAKLLTAQPKGTNNDEQEEDYEETE